MTARTAQPAELTRYVRVRSIRENGLIEFDFIVGDADLTVELILPAQAFEEFCTQQGTVPLSPEQGEALDHDRAKWQYGQPGITE